MMHGSHDLRRLQYNIAIVLQVTRAPAPSEMLRRRCDAATPSFPIKWSPTSKQKTDVHVNKQHNVNVHVHGV